MNTNVTKVSHNLVLRQVNNGDTKYDPAHNRHKKLVLFFPWLYATKSVVDKYCDIYHKRNMDVLCANVELKHFLRPSTGRKFAREILDYLNGNNLPLNADHFVVHAFSIGAYLYSIILLEMEQNKLKYNAVSKKICGQIFDSITVGGLDRMGRGIAEFTSNPITRFLIQGSASSYFALTKPYTVKFYDETIEQFKHKPLKTPVMFVYSLNDPMASSDAMEEIIALWQNPDKFNMDVSVKCWEKSVHAGHLREHPQQYLDALHAFLIRIGSVSGSKL